MTASSDTTRSTQRPELQPVSALYCATGERHLEDLLANAYEAGSIPPPSRAGASSRVRWSTANDSEAVLEHLRNDAVRLLVLDLRPAERSRPAFERCVQRGRLLLESLADPEDVEARYSPQRIVALVSGPDPNRVDELLLELGARGLRHVLRDDSEDATGPEQATLARDFAQRVVDRVRGMLRDEAVGKRALCCSGGGVTGIYFELGALKCLDDCLSGPGINGFDLFFGVSAGAVIASLLSVGYSVDELMASIAGAGGGRVPTRSPGLLALGQLEAQDVSGRLKAAARVGARAVPNLLRGRARPSLDALFLEYTDLVGPPFRSDQIEAMLRTLLTAPGATNDFRELGGRLFIGAQDPSSREQVLYGSSGAEDLPISRAVQASVSVSPAVSAVSVRGRYYQDGTTTRTSNFVEAVRRGATLVCVVDPFVPYVSEQPGLVRRRGILYQIDQDLRTISFARYESSRDWLLGRQPSVSCYTFLPQNRLRRLLGIHQMDPRPYLSIWRGAYLSTLGRIQAVRHRLCGDLALQGLTLDTTRAEAVARQLRTSSRPSFADFFPERVVKLKRPALARER